MSNSNVILHVLRCLLCSHAFSYLAFFSQNVDIDPFTGAHRDISGLLSIFKTKYNLFRHQWTILII